MVYFEPLLSFTPVEYVVPESLYKEIKEYTLRTSEHPFYHIQRRLQLLIDKDVQAGLPFSAPFDMDKVIDELATLFHADSYDPMDIQHSLMSNVYAGRWGYLESSEKGPNDISKIKLERAKQCKDIADAFIEEEAQYVKDDAHLKELMRTKERELYKKIKQTNVVDEHNRKLEYILFLWQQWFKWCNLPVVDDLDTYLKPLPIKEYTWTPKQLVQLEVMYANPEQTKRYPDFRMGDLKELCSFAVIPPMWVCDILQAFRITDEIVLECRDDPDAYIAFFKRQSEEATRQGNTDNAYYAKNNAAYFERIAYHFIFKRILYEADWEAQWDKYDQTVPPGYHGDDASLDVLRELAKKGKTEYEKLSEDEQHASYDDFRYNIAENKDNKNILLVNHWFLSVRSQPELAMSHNNWIYTRDLIQELSGGQIKADDMDVLNESLLYGYLLGFDGKTGTVAAVNQHFYWDVVCTGNRYPIPGKRVLKAEIRNRKSGSVYNGVDWTYHRRFVDMEPQLPSYTENITVAIAGSRALHTREDWMELKSQYRQLPYEEWMKPLETKLGIRFGRYDYNGLEAFLRNSKEESTNKQVKEAMGIHLNSRQSNINLALSDAESMERLEKWKKIKRYHSHLFYVLKYTAL
jgi:hypothetical protein